MTREQQVTTRALEKAEADWLLSYGWVRQNGDWSHPRSQLSRNYSTRDAVSETRANTRLGWPDRQYR